MAGRRSSSQELLSKFLFQIKIKLQLKSEPWGRRGSWVKWLWWVMMKGRKRLMGWSSSASSHNIFSPPPSTPPPFHPSSTPPLNINNFLLPLPTTSLINPPSLKDTSIPPSYTPPPLLPSSTTPSLPVATIEWFKNIITCHTSRHFSQVCLQN